MTNAIKYGVEGPRGNPDAGRDPWCWWKRDYARIERQEVVLGELVDILHFLLTGLLDDGWLSATQAGERLQGPLDMSIDYLEENGASDVPLSQTLGLVCDTTDSYWMRLSGWLVALYALGFTVEDVNDFYGKSVEKNLTRWGAELDAPE